MDTNETLTGEVGGARGAIPGRVLRVKEGYNPNSSSLGSIVFSIPAALIAAPVLLAGTAALIASRFACSADEPADESESTPAEDKELLS